MEDYFSGVVLYIFGINGSGKKTVAEYIVDCGAGFKLIDNSAIDRLIFSHIFPEDKLFKRIPYYSNKIRDTLIDMITENVRMHHSYIFIDQLFQNSTTDLAKYKKVLKFSEDRGNVFIPIKLVCDENMLNSRKNISTEEMINRKIDNKKIIKLNGRSAIFSPNHKNVLVINTTNRTIPETAEMILEKIKKVKINFR